MKHNKRILISKEDLKNIWCDTQFDIAISQLLDDPSVRTAFDKELNNEESDEMELEIIIKTRPKMLPPDLNIIGSHGIPGEESTK